MLKYKETSHFSKALSVGMSGGKAMTFNIVSLMWIRTVLNYQYRHGTSFSKTIKLLYKEGGIKRFYSGFTFALIQGPLVRFFDTFSNSLILEMTSKYELPIFMKTILSSLVASSFKVALAPLDTLKTMYQIEGKLAPRIIKNKISEYGISSLYHGISAAVLSGFIGHYPWFVVHNYLDVWVPKYKDNKQKIILRNALIGFLASSASSVTSNFMRVIKTSRQTSVINRSYVQVVEKIRRKSGWKGVLFRGLGVRLLTNGIQGLCFNVIWKYIQNEKNIKKTKNKL